MPFFQEQTIQQSNNGLESNQEIVLCSSKINGLFATNKQTSGLFATNKWFVCNYLRLFAINFHFIAFVFTLHTRALVGVLCGGPKKSPRTFI